MGSVEVTDADLEDPTLAAELAELSGEMGVAPAPAPRPASAPSSGSNSAGVAGEIARLTQVLGAAKTRGDRATISKIEAHIAKLQKDKAASSPAGGGAAAVPAPAAVVRPAAAAVDPARIADLEKQILLRKKAAVQAKKQGDKQKALKLLRESKQLEVESLDQLDSKAKLMIWPAGHLTSREFSILMMQNDHLSSNRKMVVTASSLEQLTEQVCENLSLAPSSAYELSVSGATEALESLDQLDSKAKLQIWPAGHF